MKSFVAVALLLLLSTTAVAQPRFADPDRAKKLAAAYPEIERIFTKWVEGRHMPGAVMGVIVDGELTWVKAAGVRKPGGEAVTPDTLFRVASMSKSFTAMAILKLRDEGKLAVDDPAAKYLPELKTLRYPTADSPVITIRHLLTHSEGFPEDNPWGDRQQPQSREALSSWMKSGIPFSTTPGTAFEYSNYGFALLGEIIGRVSGKPFDVYIRENILLPLGMTRSTYHVPPAAENAAIGYRWQDEQWLVEPIMEHGTFGAMGGLWTSARELSRYVAFLMAAFPPRDEADRSPIRRSSAREMQQLARFSGARASRATVEAPLEMTAGGYGYGLSVLQDCRFEQVVTHGGGYPGYGSLMSWLPEHGVGLIAMGSLTYTGWRGAFNDSFEAMRKTGALEPRPPVASPALLSLQSDATKLIAKWDDALASRIVADNFFLDQTAERRKTEYRELVAKHGDCRMGAIKPINALRGTWKLSCDRGEIDVTMTLAPTMPPLVQFLYARSILPPSETLRTTLTGLLQLGEKWDASAAGKLRVADDDLESTRSKVAALSSGWGKCAVSDALGGDGVNTTTMKLVCDRGIVNARLTLDADTKRVKSLDLTPSGEKNCVP